MTNYLNTKYNTLKQQVKSRLKFKPSKIQLVFRTIFVLIIKKLNSSYRVFINITAKIIDFKTRNI